jgi:hypothetical protein
MVEIAHTASTPGRGLDNRIQGRNEIALRERLLQQVERSANSTHVDPIVVQPPQQTRVFDVLGATREHFRDDQIAVR